MRRAPNYVPKDKKANYKIVVPFLLLSFFLGFFVFKKYFYDDTQVAKYYTFCNLDYRESAKVLNKRQEAYKLQETIDFNDYGLYGESLNIYQNNYEVGEHDEFYGNTLFLSNVCKSGSESDKLPYLLGSFINDGIDISSLEDGLYELEVLSDFKFKRLKSDLIIDEYFYSAKRDNKIKEVRLFTNKEIINLNREEEIIKDSYLFIEVNTIEDNDMVDLVINPARFTETEFGIDYGHFLSESFNEAHETYKMAIKVKEILEENGVRVKVLRNNSSPVNNYGEDGRLAQAYELNAKYMLNMRFESSANTVMDRGISILHSSYANNRFASLVGEHLVLDAKLDVSPYLEKESYGAINTFKKNNNLDNNNIIRESGGKFTGTAIDAEFKDLMAFAKDKNGIETIDLLYGFMTYDADYKKWINSFDEIAEATANGILDILGSAERIKDDN